MGRASSTLAPRSTASTRLVLFRLLDSPSWKKRGMLGTPYCSARAGTCSHTCQERARRAEGGGGGGKRDALCERGRASGRARRNCAGEPRGGGGRAGQRRLAAASRPRLDVVESGVVGVLLRYGVEARHQVWVGRLEREGRFQVLHDRSFVEGAQLPATATGARRKFFFFGRCVSRRAGEGHKGWWPRWLEAKRQGDAAALAACADKGEGNVAASSRCARLLSPVVFVDITGRAAPPPLRQVSLSLPLRRALTVDTTICAVKFAARPRGVAAKAWTAAS